MPGKRYKTNYIVEAPLIMAIVSSVMVSLIQLVYRQCRQANENMRFQEMMKILRHKETMPGGSPALDIAPYQIKAERGMSHVSDRVEGGNWSLDVGSNIYELEEFIRLLTLVQGRIWR